GAAFEFDIGEAHREASVLRIVAEQPAIEMLIHHRGGNREMQRWGSAIIQRLWIELSFDRWRVIDDLQTRPRRERAKVARVLRCWRMMQKFGGKSFHDPIHIVHAELAFIDEEPISWRFAFEERRGSFDSPNSPDKRSDEQRN